LDNYPAALAPAFHESGSVSTLFDVWWPQIKGHFQYVPDDVAKYWSHEHWSHSPFAWLPSAKLRFELVDWPLKSLREIRSRWCDYHEGSKECADHGHYLLKLNYPTAAYMKEHGCPPVPVIVLDTRDGVFKFGDGLVSQRERALPAAYVLVEGHRRFNLALALQEQNRLTKFPIWLMRVVSYGSAAT
jgi:hypothetical protein